MLTLPAKVRMEQAPQLWSALEAQLQAEAARCAPGTVLELRAEALGDFDSSALTLLLGALRLCAGRGLRLQIGAPPAKLRELARVYGVEQLLWPTADGAADPAQADAQAAAQLA